MLTLSDLTPDQLDAINWLTPRTEALLAYPVGFGKTIICLTAIANIRRIYGPWQTLLVSTKAICEHTWAEELAGWAHLPRMCYRNASGRNPLAAKAGADISAVNFESLEWYLDLVDTGEVDLPEILVIDESSKMKAADSNRVQRLAGLRRITKKGGVKHIKTYLGFVHRFKRRFLLSATPNPEGYEGLWAQEACMSTRRRLGENITSFRDQFSTRDRSGFGWDVLPSSEPIIEEKLKHVMHLPPKGDYMDLPPPTHSRILVPWSDKARAEYKEMEDELELALESLDPSLGLDEVEIVAPNAGVLRSKLRQLCSGFLYDKEGQAHPTSDSLAKLDALDALRERTNEAPLLVFTQFRAEMEHIAERHRDAQIRMPSSLKAWNAKRVPMLVLHPASAGHGLNLQQGTHICAYYSMPESYEQWHQSWGRIHRRGQRFPVSVIRFERPNSVDQDVYAMTQKKGARLADFLQHMRERRGLALS